jgi:hypothetical protein
MEDLQGDQTPTPKPRAAQSSALSATTAAVRSLGITTSSRRKYRTAGACPERVQRVDVRLSERHEYEPRRSQFERLGASHRQSGVHLTDRASAAAT